MKRLCLFLTIFPLLCAYDRQKDLKPQDYPLFEQLSKDLRCPACQGLSVWESEAAFSNQIKDMIKTKINAGLNQEQVMQFFTARFGLWIMREPPERGFGALAWWIPIGLMLVGPLGLWLFVWRKRKTVPRHGVRAVAELAAQMQEELTALRPEYEEQT